MFGILALLQQLCLGLESAVFSFDLVRFQPEGFSVLSLNSVF